MKQSVEGDEDGEKAEVKNCRVLRERTVKGDLLVLSLVPRKAWGRR